MIKRTSVLLWTTIFGLKILTLQSLVIQRMIFHFLPSMTTLTSVLLTAAVLIIHQKRLTFPLNTLLTAIIIFLWLPPEVLPIMTIITGTFVMIELVEWTEHCFEKVHIEQIVFGKCVDQWHFYLIHIMGEWTENTIFTLLDLEGKFVAEFSPVLYWSVQLFYVVMTVNTSVTFFALFVSLYLFADLRRVLITSSTTVVFIVKIYTVLLVVILFYFAFFYFEHF